MHGNNYFYKEYISSVFFLNKKYVNGSLQMHKQIIIGRYKKTSKNVDCKSV